MKIVFKNSCWWMSRSHVVRNEFPMSGYVSTYCGISINIHRAQVHGNAGLDEVSCPKCLKAAS